MRRLLVLLLALLGAGALRADGPRLVGDGAPAAIEWVEPRAGAEAIAGEALAISWRPASDDAASFEEWEAFLSLDGGAHWPYRLTPHLDRRISRFVVELPPLAASRARLLLRYGNEREERELLLPFEFAIAAPRRVAFRSDARVTTQPGEAARPGEAGVVAWVDGPRDGAPLVRVERRAPLDIHPVPALTEPRDHELALVESAPEPPPPSARSVELPPLPGHAASCAALGAPRAAPSGALRLALLGRRNE